MKRAAKITIIDDCVIQQLIIADSEVIDELFLQYERDLQILEDETDLLKMESIKNLAKACDTLGIQFIIVCDTKYQDESMHKYVISTEEFCEEYGININASHNA